MKQKIFTNEEAAKDLLELCKTAKNQMQGICNELKATGFDFTHVEILNLVRSRNGTNGIKNAVFAKIPACKNPEFAGIPLSKEKLKELIEVPNIDNAAAAIENFDCWQALQYITIIDGKAEIRDTARAQIEELHTVYAENAEQLKRYETFNKVCAALNEYKAVFPYYQIDIDIKGVVYENNHTFTPDFKELAKV